MSMGTFESLSTEDSPRGFQKEEHAAGLFLYGRFFNISPRSLLSLEVFPEITSPRCPVIGRGRTMRARAPAVAVQMPTSGTLQLQSLRNRRRGSLLLPSRRKTPNFPAKRLLSYPRVLKGNICLQGRAHVWAGGLLSHRGLCWFNSSGHRSEILLHSMWLNLKELSFCMWHRSCFPTPVDSALLSKVRSVSSRAEAGSDR